MVLEEGACPFDKLRSVTEVVQYCLEPVMVNVIEEAPYIKKQDAGFETRGMCRLDIVDEGDACIKTRRVHATPKLVGWDEFMCNNVVLHAFCDGFLHVTVTTTVRLT